MTKNLFGKAEHGFRMKTRGTEFDELFESRNIVDENRWIQNNNRRR